MVVNSRKKKIVPEIEKNLAKQLNKSSFKKIIVGIIILAIVVLLLKNFLIVAVVNNAPIWRLTLIRELERQAGKQVLEGLISNSIILQEANKRKINISQKEIDNELVKIETSLLGQGQTLNQVLSLQGMSKDDLKYQLKLRLIINKLVENKVVITDKDVDNYFKENKEVMPDESKKEETRVSIKEQLKQTKINEQARKLYEELKAKAKIYYLINY